jgi:hypothetical protein
MVLEEFEPVDEVSQGAGSEQKAKIQKSATSLFVLTWENCSTAPPINVKKDMGKTVAKQVFRIYQHHTCMYVSYMHVHTTCIRHTVMMHIHNIRIHTCVDI